MLDEFKRERWLYVSMLALFVVVLVGVVYLLRRPEPRVVTVTTPAPRPTATLVIIQIQVTGAVANPGLYKLPEGSRVTDALDLAGGARPEADVSKLNLARKLKDGEALAVLARPVTVEPAFTPTLRGAGSTQEPGPVPTQTAVRKAKINLNTASVTELDTLPRIGPVLAQRIVDYRMQHGSFQQIEEIKNVSGIGDSLFATIRDLITIIDE